MLQGMKILKLYGWERMFKGFINVIRGEELDRLFILYFLSALNCEYDGVSKSMVFFNFFYSLLISNLIWKCPHPSMVLCQSVKFMWKKNYHHCFETTLYIEKPQQRMILPRSIFSRIFNIFIFSTVVVNSGTPIIANLLVSTYKCVLMIYLITVMHQNANISFLE